MKRVGVFTSIPLNMSRMVGNIDYGPAIREACVQQWGLAGYPVSSLNPESELAQLAQNPIRAQILSNGTASERTSVGYMAQLALQQKVDVAIFTNADCLLLDIPKLRRVVECVKPESVCLLERLNIDQNTLRTTGQHCAGFDAFVIGAKALEFIDRGAHWKIGDTWWDYWLPVSILLGGGHLNSCVAPIFMHINHPLGWNFETWKRNGERFANETLNKDMSAVGRDFQDFFTQQKMRKLSRGMLLAIGDFTFNWLKKTAEPIDSALPGTIDELKNLIFLEIANAKSNAISEKSKLFPFQLVSTMKKLLH